MLFEIGDKIRTSYHGHEMEIESAEENPNGFCLKAKVDPEISVDYRFRCIIPYYYPKIDCNPGAHESYGWELGYINMPNGTRLFCASVRELSLIHLSERWESSSPSFMTINETIQILGCKVGLMESEDPISTDPFTLRLSQRSPTRRRPSPVIEFPEELLRFTEQRAAEISPRFENISLRGNLIHAENQEDTEEEEETETESNEHVDENGLNYYGGATTGRFQISPRWFFADSQWPTATNLPESPPPTNQ